MSYTLDNGDLNIKKIIKHSILGVSVITFIIALFAMNPFVKIDAGERGVVLNWGAVEPVVLQEGIHWRVPIKQQIIQMNVQTQLVEAEAVASSKDLQSVTSKVALNYHIAPDEASSLYQNIGIDYVSRIINPAIQESLKAATAKFTAEELITKRPDVKAVIRDELKKRLETSYLVVDDISITNFAFSKEFTDAIEAKQVAEQNVQKANNDLKRIEVEAQQKIETAKADAESIRIQGDALKENPELVDLKAVEKWNGTLPQYMLGNSTPFINIQ